MPEESPIGKLIHIRTTKEEDVPAEKRAKFHKLKESIALPAFRSYAEDNEVLSNLRNALR